MVATATEWQIKRAIEWFGEGAIKGVKPTTPETKPMEEPKSALAMEDLILGVKAYLEAHKHLAGWERVRTEVKLDRLVVAIGGAKTVHGAISNVAKHFGVKKGKRS